MVRRLESLCAVVKIDNKLKTQLKNFLSTGHFLKQAVNSTLQSNIPVASQGRAENSSACKKAGIIHSDVAGNGIVIEFEIISCYNPSNNFGFMKDL